MNRWFLGAAHPGVRHIIIVTGRFMYYLGRFGSTLNNLKTLFGTLSKKISKYLSVFALAEWRERLWKALSCNGELSMTETSNKALTSFFHYQASPCPTTLCSTTYVSMEGSFPLSSWKAETRLSTLIILHFRQNYHTFYCTTFLIFLSNSYSADFTFHIK